MQDSEPTKRLITAVDALADLWRQAGLPAQALTQVTLPNAEPVLPSSFAVGTAAQVSIAAAALAACELGHQRGAPRQQVEVDMRDAAMECTGWFSVDGDVPPKWDAFSGLYACSDGWVRVHANFQHHRDGVIRLLGLSPEAAQRTDVEAALRGWRAEAFEDAAAQQDLVVAALRRFEDWDAHPQAKALQALPLWRLERIGDAPPLPLSRCQTDQRPLEGLRVIDLTRILAGPVAGRTLAAYGAEVMLLNAPDLPNIPSIAETSRGKLSAHVDLRTPEGQGDLRRLVEGAHVLVQGYRPGAVARLGWGPEAATACRPGLVYVSLSAYGDVGPWAERRGFDSLVQTATGFNHAEGHAAGGPQPRALPVQTLDYATGFLIAFVASVAVRRQQMEGGSWHVRLSLAQTAQWLRQLGRVTHGFDMAEPSSEPWREASNSGFGALVALRHAANLSRTPAKWVRPSVPPGTSLPTWPSGPAAA